MDGIDKDLVQKLLTEGQTYYDEMSHSLKQVYPGVQGLSARSVRRFCSKEGIKKLKGPQLDTVVEEAIDEVNAE